MSNTVSRPTNPSTDAASATDTDSPANAITWSSALCASRMLPSAARASNARAAASIVTPSVSAIVRNCSVIAAVPMVLNSKTCERDKMVSGILSSRVVAMMKTTCGGGSSTDFSNALNELADNWCTSSMMNTL